MAIPGSGPISWSTIQGEFGGAAPTAINEYYRGGGLVPNAAPNLGVPTSGTISANQFYGTSGGTALANNKSSDASGSVFLPEPAPTSTSVGSNTVTCSGTGGSGSYTYSWAYLSGDAGVAATGSGASRSFSATVNKNSSTSAIWRCTVNDGITTAFVDVNISLSYSTDL